MQFIKQSVVISLHMAPPLLGGWAAHLWHGQHEVAALWLAIMAGLLAVGALGRDWWLDEIAEALSPTRIFHNRTSIEPPRPLPAFDDGPSRIRIKAIGERVESVAPADAANEDTWTDQGVA